MIATAECYNIQRLNRAASASRPTGRPQLSARQSQILLICRYSMDSSSNEPAYDVLWPLARKKVRERERAARLDDLSGKTVAEVWDYIFRGEMIFPEIRAHLKARYPGIKFV